MAADVESISMAVLGGNVTIKRGFTKITQLGGTVRLDCASDASSGTRTMWWSIA